MRIGKYYHCSRSLGETAAFRVLESAPIADKFEFYGTLYIRPVKRLNDFLKLGIAVIWWSNSNHSSLFGT